MSKRENLQKILASYCNKNYLEIDLTKSIKDRYVVQEEKEPFCDDICLKWQLGNTKCTALHNKVFDSLKTGEDIIEFLP